MVQGSRSLASGAVGFRADERLRLQARSPSPKLMDPKP